LPETKPVFEKVAKEKIAPIIFATDRKYVADWHYDHHQLNVTIVEKETDQHINYRLDLHGIYQRKNLITVLEAIHCLIAKGFSISNEQLHKGLSQTKKITGLHGRWELIHQKPAVVLDVAHNVDGIKQLAEQIEISTYNDLHIVIGMVKDKEIEKILEQLPKYATYYFTKAQIPRALPANELHLKAARVGLKGNIYNDVNIALKEALQYANDEDLIIVCGSVFLIGEVTELSTTS
jgi:dihydrofolate synthase/folylpolyglutamate synthase